MPCCFVCFRWLYVSKQYAVCCVRPGIRCTYCVRLQFRNYAPPSSLKLLPTLNFDCPSHPALPFLRGLFPTQHSNIKYSLSHTKNNSKSPSTHLHSLFFTPFSSLHLLVCVSRWFRECSPHQKDNTSRQNGWIWATVSENGVKTICNQCFQLQAKSQRKLVITSWVLLACVLRVWLCCVFNVAGVFSQDSARPCDSGVCVGCLRQHGALPGLFVLALCCVRKICI